MPTTRRKLPVNVPAMPAVVVGEVPAATRRATRKKPADKGPAAPLRNDSVALDTPDLQHDAGSESSGLSSTPEEAPSPKKKRAPKAKPIVVAVAPPSDADIDTVAQPKLKRKRKAKSPPVEGTNGAADDGEEEQDAPKPKRKRVVKPKPPIVYDIPDVVRKKTTFKGELTSVSSVPR